MTVNTGSSGSPPRPSKIAAGLSFEYIFAALILIAIYFCIRHFISFGYLPEPFFDDTTDTFMDWYNTAYWAQNGGAFEFWGSVYPPMSLLFVKLFSVHHCYITSPLAGRSCDPTGEIVLTAMLAMNVALTYVVLRKSIIAGAAPRAVALGLGAPMLLAWERGNLIIPCYTVFILAYGRLPRSGSLKLLFVAVTLNFKPYLAVLGLARLVRRDFRWAEGVAVYSILIYAVTYLILGEGNPAELLRDLLGFGIPATNPPLNSLRFAVTYQELLRLITSPYPLMGLIGSRPIETLETWLPLFMGVGKIGVLGCLGGAVLRSKALSLNTTSALSMCLLFNTASPGGYALDFLLFFIFLEPSAGFWRITMLICAYIWCIPWDFPVMTIAHGQSTSYLSGRTVFTALNLAVGQFARPAVFLIMEYALVISSLIALARSTDRGSAALSIRQNAQARAIPSAPA